MAELEERKKTLIQELDRARAQLSAHARGVRAHAHPGTKLRAAFAKNRLPLISGAALFGLLLAKIPARAKKIVVNQKAEKQVANAGKAGLALGALKMAFDLGKPFLMSWATGRLGGLGKGLNQSHDRRN